MSTFAMLTDVEQRVVDELLQCGRVTGYEFVAVMDMAGETVLDFRTDRIEDGSDIGLRALDEMRKENRIVVRHNHPAMLETCKSLSCADWRLLVGHEFMSELSAHGVDGTSYRAAVPAGMRPRLTEIVANLDSAEGEAHSVLQNALIPPAPRTPSSFDDLDIEQQAAALEGTFAEMPDVDSLETPRFLAMHAVGLALNVSGVARYEVDSGPVLRDILAKSEVAVGKAQAAVKSILGL